VPWLRRLVASLSPRRPGFDPGSVHVRFVVNKVALGEVFPPVLRFSPINFIPPVLHYLEKRKKKLIIFITGLHNKPQGCGASLASAAGPFTKKSTALQSYWVTDERKNAASEMRCSWGVHCNSKPSLPILLIQHIWERYFKYLWHRIHSCEEACSLINGSWKRVRKDTKLNILIY
jgi:hypothetical protein